METVVIASVDDVTGEVGALDGISLREVSERDDLDRVGAMEEAIWHDGRAGWLADSLENEQVADPQAITIVVAESTDDVVCAGWVRFVSGTDFATLWGGARSPAGAAAASTARSSCTGPTSPRSAGSATSRSTRRRRVARSSSGWASSPSRPPRRSSGRRRAFRIARECRQEEALRGSH